MIFLGASSCGAGGRAFRGLLCGTLQTECLDYHNEPMGAAEMQEIIDEWIFRYENQRPHEGLGFLTPREFENSFYSSEHPAVS